MTQYAHPNGDVSDGSWVNAGGGQGALNSNIRRGTGDSSYIISTDSFGVADTCRFRLQNGDDPLSDSDHVVHYRAVATAGDPMMGGGSPPSLTILIYDTNVGSPIVTETNNSVSTSSLTDYSFTLEDAEARAITEYDDLEISFVRGAGMGGETMKITEAWIQYPDEGTPPAATGSPAFLLFS